MVKEATGDPIYLDKSVMPDAAVLARIKELGAPIEALKAKEVSETTKAVDGSRDNCRARECEMGNLVSDAILDRVKGQGVQIVFQNGGGLRASIDQGVVTMGEVLTVLPFQNTLSTFEISGKDVVAALENGASQLEEGAGRFAQVAGLKYSFDKSAPVNSRISAVEVMEGGAWKPIDPAKTYLAATNNYVRQGGDGYKIFATTGRTPMTTARAWSRWSPTISPRTGPTRPSSTAASPRSPRQRAMPPSLRHARQRTAAAAGDRRLRPKPADAGGGNNHARDRRRRQFLEPRQDLLQGPDQVAAIADANPGNRPRALQIGKIADHPVGCELSILAPDDRARPALPGGLFHFRLAVRPDVALNSTAQRIVCRRGEVRASDANSALRKGHGGKRQ